MKIFHHNDADGRLSAFLVIRQFRDCIEPEDVIEIDHARPIPVDVIKDDELVFIVDFSFSGKLINVFKEITMRTQNIVWIDHHADFIKMEKDEPWTAEIRGVRKANILSRDGKNIKFSGAALTMVYLKSLINQLSVYSDINKCTGEPKEDLVSEYLSYAWFDDYIDDTYLNFDFSFDLSKGLKEMVEYVSDYDTFSRAHDDFEEFYHGVSQIDQDPMGTGWLTPVPTVISKGKEIKAILDPDNENYLKRNAMILQVPLIYAYDLPGEYNITTVLAVNKEGNSFIFNSVPDLEKNFPVRMLFRVQDTHRAKVTFFSNDGDSTARDLAVQFGGGGHPQAAGCTIPLKEWDDTFTMVERYEEWLKRYEPESEHTSMISATPASKTNETGVWEIWREGFCTNGDRGQACRIDVGVVASSFGEACRKSLVNDSNFRYNEEKDICSIWGCSLYDNEKDARHNFG